MATTYKKRRRAFGGEQARDEAVRRIQNEASVRAKLGGSNRQAADSGPRSRGGTTSPPAHGGSPVRAFIENEQRITQEINRRHAEGRPAPTKRNTPDEQRQAYRGLRHSPGPSRNDTRSEGGSALRNRPRRFQTTRGLRRLSFREAYSRRTTDSSRARVLKLYGRSAPPKYGPSNLGRGNLLKTGPGRIGSGSVSAGRGVGNRVNAPKGDGTHGGALQKVAQMRSRLQKQKQMDYLPRGTRVRRGSKNRRYF